MRVGLIARMDKSGLGQGQTVRLNRLLKPDKLMLIDSTSFNGDEQHPEWYGDVEAINGFPNTRQVQEFLKDIDVAISCELFYHSRFTDIAKGMGVKTILIANPEFFDWFTPQYEHISPPTKVIVPSQWMMGRMKPWNPTYIPTPIFENEFEKAREINLKRTGKPRYLFLNGKTAAHDRAGLESLYEALQLAEGDFEVVVKAQGEVKKHPDHRLTYDLSNPDEQWKLYAGFDAMILPRRYAGQALNCNEALMSGLPVIMTNVPPNNVLLPQEWLVDVTKIGEFMTRIMIDIHSAVPQKLADKINWLTALSNEQIILEKEKSFAIGDNEFNASKLLPMYEAMVYNL